ncbi:hypothetical protein GGS26DRAFT_560982 [Hypomontagnella submonticulosa]|nr:hypothetical protein GGS26DRAFT_560982 [Hypomontagnella submonticulosa]
MQRQRIESWQTRTAQTIIGRCMIGEEFPGFRSLPFYLLFQLSTFSSKGAFGYASDRIRCGVAFHARAQKPSFCFRSPLTLLRHCSFAETCTNPASTLMNGILQNHPCHLEAANVPLHRKNAPRSSYSAFSLATTMHRKSPELAQGNHLHTFSDHYPERWGLYYFMGYKTILILGRLTQQPSRIGEKLSVIFWEIRGQLVTNGCFGISAFTSSTVL